MASPAAEKHVFLFPDSKVYSGTVIMPGGFDQQGCSLVIFPKSQHCKLSDLSNEDLGNVFKYFLHLHNTHQFGCCMISVVVDLRTATLDILSHIVNGLLHVQNHLGSILGTFYALQPQRKELRKFLLKSLRLCQKRGLLESPLKCILPNKACDLFSYIDQSQLTSEFGGYFMYEHEKWVCFRKEMDGFSRQYTSVFKRLPSCLVRLEALGCEPFPSRQEELKGFSQQIQNSYTSLRRWLGIDDLQSKCESIVHKFQKREVDCYQAVSGTIMFNLAFVNVLNHRQRIRASMDKMEWLWQKACAKIQFSLKKLEYKQAAQEIIEFISTQAMRKLEAYEIQIASSISQAEVLRQEYMSAIYDPAMILLEHVADVIENLECLEGGNEVEDYIWQLWKLKERFSAAVEIPFQTLKSIHDYHYLFNKATHWYRLVLNQISFKNALWHEMDRQLSITGDVTHINPAWNEHVHSFVTNNPLPDPEEFVHLGQLSYLLSELQRLPGAQLSYRCLVLWQLLTCHEQVLPTDLQQAIYWQQSFLDFHSKPYSLTEDAKIVTSEPKAVRGIFIPQTLLQNCQNNCKSSVTSNRRHSSSSGQGHKTRNESERVEDASQRIGASMQNIDQLEKNISYWNISTGKSFSNLPVELRNLNQAYAKSNHKAQLNTHGQENIFNPVSIDKKIASKSKKLECGTNIATTLRIKGQRDTHIENCNVSATQSASLLNPWLSLPLEDLDQPYVTVMFESPLPQILHDKSSFVHSKDKLSQQISSVVDFSINKQVTTRSVEIQVSDTSLNIFAFRECAVQTDDSICYEPSDFQASKCELSPVKLALCSTFNEAERLQDINDSSKSIIWDSYDLHPSRLLESSKTNHIINEPEWLSDWDTKEQIHLCNIESLLNKAETVLQEEEHILKHEKEMEHFLEMEMLKSEKQEIAENIQNLDCVHQEAVSSNTENIYIGHEAQHIKSVLNIKNPVTHGIVTDWDDLEKIWHYTFYDQLHADPEQHPVMLTETAMNPESRAHMVQIMFEAFSVPFAYIAVQAVLALYSTGRTSGVVFDSGDDVSYSVPVYEGYSLPHAIQRLNLAGCDLTNYLQKLLQKNGCLFRAPTQEIAREMKEKCCYVAQDAETELPSEVHYNLPDGQSITLSTERFRAPEVLFKQELIGKDQDGVHESLCRSLLLTDVDLRKTFAENLVLSGGNTLLTGLPLRLQKEICSLVPVNLRDSVSVTSVPDQDFAVWNGGAALVSSPAFHTAWISKQEYDEFGPDIVYKRCF
ncbi:uncharacterized protein LOC115087836 isoform X12 [Rhinatrema bivittatum]|uniref:uncharacterized protein LOC115087836 isoform X12 n=1 Tax=Rhinatrema bivittatum TaxID=194408 RepID=UPI00112A3B02|nr:uncharacterized protein LOC115087836 isoform X12 [Rhinatrema bivittatum]